MRLLTAVSILLHIANIPWPIAWRRVYLLTTEFSDVTAPYLGYMTLAKSLRALQCTVFHLLAL